MNKKKWILVMLSVGMAVAVMAKWVAPDSPLEELTEGALQSEMGIDVDLSPNT